MGIGCRIGIVTVSPLAGMKHFTPANGECLTVIATVGNHELDWPKLFTLLNDVLTSFFICQCFHSIKPRTKKAYIL